ncbi:hypothetical protein [Streptomyces sp. ALI-76-A]|uniref:hypothetical protein n=1 Tax=Streptomyces sp. ALI-76-A TaxID=3025736 RepID=UPI00256EBEBC|nr:hypothetical protein [Streptomyces sp. ALI-76-A]MDL5205077.1 hypothetical protein [Streptomyces sp. ALI-76-A]
MSARTDILDALERDGYKSREAISLLERADKEPQTPTGLGDPDFPTTLSGGHALIVEYGDCEFYGYCQCGKALGMVTPDKFGDDTFGGKWERHVMTEVAV